MTAYDPQSPILRPGIDALKNPVDEVQRAVGVEDRSPDCLETASKLVDRGTLRGDYSSATRRRSRYVEPREFALPHRQPAGHVLDGIVVRILAQPQKCC